MKILEEALELQTPTADVAGAALPLGNNTLVSLHFTWTGTLDGAVRMDVSNTGYDGEWVPLTDSIQNTGGVAGNHIITYYAAGTEYVRAVYIHDAGSGTIKATAKIKR
jgi:hypothetical protein